MFIPVCAYKMETLGDTVALFSADACVDCPVDVVGLDDTLLSLCARIVSNVFTVDEAAEDADEFSET